MNINMLPVCLVEIQELQCVIREGRHTHSSYIRPGFLGVVMHQLSEIEARLTQILAPYPRLSDKEVQRSKRYIRLCVETGDEFLGIVLNALQDTQRALSRLTPCCSEDRKRATEECLDNAIRIVQQERQEEEYGLLDSYLASSRAITATEQRSYTTERLFWSLPRSASPQPRAIQVSFGCTYRAFATDDPIPPSVPETCKGCQNYHGQTHGGNLLVCAIHPYGFDGESCPDFADKNVRVFPESLRDAILVHLRFDDDVDLGRMMSGSQEGESRG